MKLQEMIYESMLGELVEPLPWVENAFAEGSKCAELYEEIYQANCSLCERLGVEEEQDVERIVDSLFEINRELCLRMYQYGMMAK